MLEYIHSKGLTFHDVKPSHIAIGNDNPNQIFFVGFAFSELYENSLDEFNQRKLAKKIKGTPEYMSKEALKRFEQVPKDDLVSLGITLLELNDANLPWMRKTDDIDDIFIRMNITLEEWENEPLKVSVVVYHSISILLIIFHSSSRKFATLRIIHNYF